ncbi:MAG: membrane dipeptidase [Planctomycetota bacterium]
MLIFDGHLDLAYNALAHERDPRLTVDQTRAREADPPCEDGRGDCTTSLAEMRSAGVAVAVTTLLARCKPWVEPGRPAASRSSDWPTPAMAHAVARGQLAYYRELERQGEVRVIETRRDLAAHWAAWQAADADATGEARTGLPVGLILTMECADPIVEPTCLRDWHDSGLRTLMLTHFGMGRYAAGNPATDPPNGHDVDGPVTPRGVELLEAMALDRMPLDLTHLSDTSFWDALDRFGGRVYSSHANCRALCDEQRQLSDDMIRAVAERGGVLGLATYFGMIRPGWREAYQSRPIRHGVTMDHWADHVDHMAQVAGGIDHVAIGSDLDGGYGAEECPNGLNRHRDLHRLAEIMRDRGYGDADVGRVFGGNWLDFYLKNLPG